MVKVYFQPAFCCCGCTFCFTW